MWAQQVFSDIDVEQQSTINRDCADVDAQRAWFDVVLQDR